MEIIQIDDFDDFLSKIDRSPHLVFRGQSVDAPLVPAIARKWRNDSDWFSCVRRREEHAYTEFLRRSKIFGKVPSKVGDFIAFAQHNGLPTRLLDWTENPLAALFFAFDAEDVQEAIVWQLETTPDDFLNGDPTPDDIFNPKKTKLYKPNCVTPRITAQRGLFSIMRLTDKYGIPLDDHPRFRDRLTKFVIDAKPGWIRRQLDKFNVNPATMYPDLTNLARHVADEANAKFPYRVRLKDPVSKID